MALGDEQNVTLAAINVTVSYRVGVSPVPGKRKLLSRQRQTVKAVQDVTLIARSGESIGLVGPNGAGKSTLLRVMAGIEPSSSGMVMASNRPLLQSVGAALIPELSGWQNISLGMSALGNTVGNSRSTQRTIADISGIDDATLQRPLHTFSSGMRARLLFAINTSVRPRILLIDEALATGDAPFTSRARKTMEGLRRSASTVIMVTHYASSVEQLCSRAVWMDGGAIIQDGPAGQVSRNYIRWAKLTANGQYDAAAELLSDARSNYSPPAFQLIN